jgi:hypothetical protein
VRFAAAFLTWCFLYWISLVAALSVLVRPAVGSGESAESIMDTMRGVGIIVLIVWTYLSIGRDAPKVGYRRGDTFFVLIPLYGPFYFVPKMLWRISGLPERKWRVTSNSLRQANSNVGAAPASAPTPSIEAMDLPLPPPDAPVSVQAPADGGLGAGAVTNEGKESTGGRRSWLVAGVVATVVLLVASSIGAFAMGSDRGRSVGLASARSDAAAAYALGKDSGYAAGLHDGQQRGYHSGYQSGLRAGRSNGRDAGATAACWWLFRKLNTDRIYDRPPGYFGPYHYYNSSICKSIKWFA